MFEILTVNCVFMLFLFNLAASINVSQSFDNIKNEDSGNARIKRYHHHGHGGVPWGHPQSNPGFSGYHHQRPEHTWNYEQPYNQEHQFNYNLPRPYVISNYDPYTDPNFSLTKNVPIPRKIYFNQQPTQQVYHLEQSLSIPNLQQENYLNNRRPVISNTDFKLRPEEIVAYHYPTQIGVNPQINNGQTTQRPIINNPTTTPQNTGIINNSQNNTNPNFGGVPQNAMMSNNSNSQNTTNSTPAQLNMDRVGDPSDMITNRILDSAISSSVFGPGADLQGQMIGPTGSLIPTPPPTDTGRVDPIDCNTPYVPPRMPNFNRVSSSVGEARCYELIFQLKIKDDIERRNKTCNFPNVLAAEQEKMKARFEIPIIGGRPAQAEEFSHMAAIGWIGRTEPFIFKCGGSLISPNFLLTAAHCQSSGPDPELTDLVPRMARLGGVNIGLNKFGMAFSEPTNSRRRRQIPDSGTTDVDIINIIPHENYNPNMVYFDIALMQLGTSLDFSRRIKPACMWVDDSTSSRIRKSVATGWGIINPSTRRTSLILQAGELDLIDTNVCNNLLRRKFGSRFNGFVDHQICAGKLSGEVDVCQGDSGGPLQVKINTGTTTIGNMHALVGIIAAGPDCGRRDSPGIYTKIANFADWVELRVWGTNTLN